VSDLGQPDRMGEAELHLAPLGSRSEEPALEVERLSVDHAPAGLPIEQEGLADVLDHDLLVIRKGIDRRVLPATRSSPRPQQERQRGEVGMDIGFHGTERTIRFARDRALRGSGVPQPSIDRLLQVNDARALLM
jgi:hypothetical protein